MLTALDSEADAVLGWRQAPTTTSPSGFGPAELRSRIRAVLRRVPPRARSAMSCWGPTTSSPSVVSDVGDLRRRVRDDATPARGTGAGAPDLRVDRVA